VGLALLSQGGSSKTRGRSKSKRTPLAREGQVIYDSFDLVAKRPMPIFISLEQGITVTMGLSLSNAFGSSTVLDTFYAKAWTLADFAIYASYVSLFDQYRIEQFEVWTAPYSVSTGLTQTLADYVTVIDLDDAATPGSYNAVLGKQGALATSGQAGHYHRWRPHVAVAEYSGAFTSYGNMPATWIDCASSGVQHYGFKASCLQSGTNEGYNVEVRAVVSFRGTSVP